MTARESKGNCTQQQHLSKSNHPLSLNCEIFPRRPYQSPLSIKLKNAAIVPLLFLLLWTQISLAVPANPEPAKVKQPDGDEITVYLKGDEFAHWNESEDGFLITKNDKTREWVYMVKKAGVAVPSRHKGGKADPAAIGALRPDKKQLAADAAANRAKRLVPQEKAAFVPSTGTMQNLVVLVNFSDLSIPYTRQAYDDLFNQEDYTADNAAGYVTGSVKDFYHEISYNTLTIQSTVVEPVTLDYGYAYYGQNSAIYPYNDLRPREMVADALAKLEQRGFDFSTMDGDWDGEVDGLTIIHAGGGEEYGGNPSNYIWSHQWYMISPVTYDGVTMWMYHTEPARRGWDSSPSSQGITRIGVVCHETGHFLGLPDLYDYDYDSYGAGSFCLMAGGSWNGNSGTTPAHMSAWCKYDLGWIAPTVISSNGVYPLSEVENNDEVFKLQGPFPATQYFLVENRQPTGFDTSLPGSLQGILIWHVDETRSNNDDQTHYLVDLEEASCTQHLELYDNDGEDTDYYRAGNKTEFSASSCPANLSYSGVPLGLDITDVGATGAIMDVTIGGTNPVVTSITPNTGAADSTVNITNLAGLRFEPGATVKLIKSGQPDIDATAVNVVSPTQITCTFSLVGAATGFWDVKVTNPDEQFGILSNGFNVTGQCVDFTEGFESFFVGGAPPGWTKSFLTGTVDWIRSTGDLSGGLAHGGSYNALLAYEGWGDHETYLITPQISFAAGTTNATLEFWHKQEIWIDPPYADQDTLKVYYKTSVGGIWTELSSFTTNIPDWTKRIIPLPNPTSTYYIGFLGNAKYGFGVCIDDVKVTGCSIDCDNPVIITIGSGANSWDYPMHTYYHDSRTQVIYLANEIGAPGTISSLGLDVATVPGQEMFNWTIRMKHTSLSSYSTAALDATGWTTVYQGTEPIGTTGWRTFNFSTPFEYNGTDNLLVDFSHNNTSFSSNGLCRYSTPGGIRSAYAYTDSGYGDPLTWTGTTSPAVYGSTNVPDLRLTVCQGGGFKISGYVKTTAETGIEGVLVSADTGENDTTDENGYYELTFTETWSGFIVPEKAGWTFEPEYLEYIDVSEDMTNQNFTGAAQDLTVQLDLSSLWMYQSLPGQTNSQITADSIVLDDPAGNSTYTCTWEFELPGDVSVEPITVWGGGGNDTSWTFAAPGCDAVGGISDSGQALKVRLTVVGNEYGNSGTVEQGFGIALLGDTNNDTLVDVSDRAIINAFYRTGSAGPFTFKDCDINCDSLVDVSDRAIANAIYRGMLGSDSIGSPCPFR